MCLIIADANKQINDAVLDRVGQHRTVVLLGGGAVGEPQNKVSGGDCELVMIKSVNVERVIKVKGVLQYLVHRVRPEVPVDLCEDGHLFKEGALEYAERFLALEKLEVQSGIARINVEAFRVACHFGVTPNQLISRVSWAEIASFLTVQRAAVHHIGKCANCRYDIH